VFHLCAVLLLRIADRSNFIFVVLTSKQNVLIIANSELVRFSRIKVHLSEICLGNVAEGIRVQWRLAQTRLQIRTDTEIRVGEMGCSVGSCQMAGDWCGSAFVPYYVRVDRSLGC
jgi:hypothetical protein